MAHTITDKEIQLIMVDAVAGNLATKKEGERYRKQAENLLQGFAADDLAFIIAAKVSNPDTNLVDLVEERRRFVLKPRR